LRVATGTNPLSHAGFYGYDANNNLTAKTAEKAG
jgi:hypothetical protein